MSQDVKNGRAIGIALIMLVTALWSLVGSCTRALTGGTRGGMTPAFAVIGLRGLLALLTLIAISAFWREIRPLESLRVRSWTRMARSNGDDGETTGRTGWSEVVASLAYLISCSSFVIAVQFAPVGIVVLLQLAVALVVAILWARLHAVPIQPRQLFVVGATGCCITVLIITDLTVGGLLGIAFAVLGGSASGAFKVASKNLRSLEQLFSCYIRAIFLMALLAPLLLVEPSLLTTPAQWTAAIVLGAFSTAIALCCLGPALVHTDATPVDAGIVGLLQPPLAAIAVYQFFGEVPRPVALASAIALFIAVGIYTGLEVFKPKQ